MQIIGIQRVYKYLQFLLIVLVFFLPYSPSDAQPWPYEVSSDTAAYTDLVNPISVNNGTVWTDTSLFTIPLTNFNFSITGVTVDTIDVLAAVGIKFRGINNYFLWGYSTVVGGTNGSLLIDKGTTTSQSPISYELSGTPGSQILKIEWKNAAFITGLWPSDTGTFANYQIWLFEADNHLELRYGPKNDTGMQLPYQGSFIRFYCYGIYGVYVGHDQVNPYLLWTNFGQPNYSPLFGTPDNGRVFSFTKNPLFSSISDMPVKSMVKVAPNPFVNSSIIFLDKPYKIKDMSLFNSIGSKVQIDFKQEGDKIHISRGNLSAGLYIFEISFEDKNPISGKILITDN